MKKSELKNLIKILIQENYKMEHSIAIDKDETVQFHYLNRDGMMGFEYHEAQYHIHATGFYQEAIDIAKDVRGKPYEWVTIYRAVPDDVDEINDGDWITLSYEYAEQHMAGEDGWHIIEDDCRAKDIIWDGNDLQEFAVSFDSDLWEDEEGWNGDDDEREEY